MIKAIALDDEPLALDIIEAFCEQNKEIALIGKFNKPNDAKKILAEQAIDLLFLDINMPSQSGLAFYKELANKPLLIFTTAYQEFAVEGFNLNAVDYLFKPFTQKRFNAALEKAIEHCKDINNNPSISIKVDSQMLHVALRDIIWIESLDNYLKIHLTNQKTLLTRMTLKSMLAMLPTSQFTRIHKSYVVAKAQVSQIRANDLWLGDIKLSISDSYKKTILDTIFH